jgi:hypothetical protein
MNEIMNALLFLAQEVKELKALVVQVQKTRSQKFDENWMDAQDVMLSLHISRRTLQSLRDNGTLPFSRINGKLYYKMSDIESLLESNYIRNLKSRRHDKGI